MQTLGPDPVLDSALSARSPGAFGVAWQAAYMDATGEPPPDVEAAAIQTHYRPQSRARLVFEAWIDRSREGRRAARRFYFVQVYASGAEASRRLEAGAGGTSKRSLRSFGPPAFLVPEWNAAVWALPNGPRLRGLRSFLQRRAFERFLERSGISDGTVRPKRPRLLRYVPRRRALLYWNSKRVLGHKSYIKLYAPGEDVPAHENLRAVAAANVSGDFVVPGVVAYAPSRRTIVMKAVRGKSFTSRIKRFNPDSFGAVGRALASLHGSDATPSRTWTPEGELRALTCAAVDLRAGVPEQAERIERLVAALERRLCGVQPAVMAPVHGNLFGDQILLHHGRVGIVDWDDFALGDPAYDIGRLFAHVLFVVQRDGLSAVGARACLAALLAGYQAGGGTAVAGERLAWHVASALVMRAKISALRILETGWRDLIATSLDEAERVLAGSSAGFPGP